MNKAKKEFMSPISLKVCFYLWVIMLFLTPAAYIYDYDCFKFDELRVFLFASVAFYTFALGTYIEINKVQQPKNGLALRFFIITSNPVSILLSALLGLTILDYIQGSLKIKDIYNPALDLFLLYLLSKYEKIITQKSDNENITLSS